VSAPPEPGAGARRPRRAAPDNAEVADVLERVADLLEVQGASPWRVRAWRGGARTAREASEPLARLAGAGGDRALERLPGIGVRLASAIAEILHTGRLALLERLEGAVSPEDLFATLPGLGEALAHRVHAELGVETLEELELAAHDGRLERVPGFGPRRTRGVRDALAGMLGRSARRRARARRWRESGAAEPQAMPSAEAPSAEERPSVDTLLAVDAEYRRRAEGGELTCIAPRRFNPGRQAWLPLLHVERDGWSFTALYSNTARAHELGRTRDWVVLFYERDGQEDQCTVVSERRGPLAGRRVVRGREAECALYYRGRGPAAAAPASP
jgi:DNA polymerase (family X)